MPREIRCIELSTVLSFESVSVLISYLVSLKLNEIRIFWGAFFQLNIWTHKAISGESHSIDELVALVVSPLIAASIAKHPRRFWFFLFFADGAVY